MQGVITYFNGPRGFGFITTLEGESFFFHVSHFEPGKQPVLEGLVEFQIAPPLSVGKKPMAVGVRYRKFIAATAVAPHILDSIGESSVGVRS
jgi:cold shock CspA family protein